MNWEPIEPIAGVIVFVIFLVLLFLAPACSLLGYPEQVTVNCQPCCQKDCSQDAKKSP